MPITTFPYDGTLNGTDLSAILIGTSYGNSVSLSIHRDVSLAWDVVEGDTLNSQGQSGDICWSVDTTEHTLVWSANVTENVTKTTKPLPEVRMVGNWVAWISGGLLTTAATGVTVAKAIAPTIVAAPLAAKITAASAAIALAGTVVGGVAAFLRWLTDPTTESWTTTYTEKGEKVFSSKVYTQIECDPENEYEAIDIPSPVPSVEFLSNECVSSVGTDVASSGLLHPPN